MCPTATWTSLPDTDLVQNGADAVAVYVGNGDRLPQ